MDLFFQSVFLIDKAKDFRRISGKTRGEVTIADLQSDAWIIGYDIGFKRGEPIDYTDPIDQDAILAKLYVKYVIRADNRLKYACRIDQERETDDGRSRRYDQLPARESSDPLVLLISRENKRRDDCALASTYSESAAYLIVLYNFDENRIDLCAFLIISRPTLKKRMDSANDTVRVQPSLFDGIERVPDSFMPLRGRRLLMTKSVRVTCDQFGWEFEAPSLP